MEEKEIRERLKNYDTWFNYPSFYTMVAGRKSFTRYVEIGVWKGEAISFLANLLRDRENLELYGVDLFENSTIPKYYPHLNNIINDTHDMYTLYNFNLVDKNVRHLIKDIKGCSWEVAKQFEDKYFDFIYIDAGHSYEEVYKDVTAWLPKIKNTGILAGHDTKASDIIRATTDVLGNKIKIWPKRNEDVWYVDFGGMN